MFPDGEAVGVGQSGLGVPEVAGPGGAADGEAVGSSVGVADSVGSSEGVGSSVGSLVGVGDGVGVGATATGPPRTVLPRVVPGSFEPHVRPTALS